VAEPVALPCGSWPSPLGADRVAGAAVRLAAPRSDRGAVYWLEQRPAEGGRHVVVRRSPDGACADLTPAGFSARTRVHEYGGGAFAVKDGTLTFANIVDQRVYRQAVAGGPPVPLTPPGTWRYADLTPDPRRGRLLGVREEALPGRAEPVSAIVAVRLDAAGDDPGTVLAAGDDFHAAPRPSPDGEALAWLAWSHPSMPWDGCELRVARLGRDGRPADPVRVAGGPHESVFQPEWGADGALYFVSDRSGWWNLYRWRDGSVEALAPVDAECGVAQWLFGMSTYALLADGTLVCALAREGTWELARLVPGARELEPVPTPYTVLADLAPDGDRVLATASGPVDGPAVVRVDPGRGSVEVLRRAAEAALPPEWIAPPEPARLPAPDGATVHGFLYRPRNPGCRVPAGERPPLLVRCHGGPTAAAVPALDLGVQFWTTRGLAVLDVNYGGSTGYGRAYRERLAGAWGVVDVADCITAARHLAGRGEADPGRLAIRGSSAGGFTVLCALAFHDAFQAGAVYYGVSDLAALARETHKFEARYLDRLVGPYPEAAETYHARSPVHHAAGIRVPVVFFQGLEDPVVPPDQTERMVAALRARGVPVEYLAFPEEAHGFRQAQTLRQCLEAELAFYGRVFGFTPAGAGAAPPGGLRG
jgi:dipeptidyl aminopeptidase/acylaminoacyl peptidase